MIQHICGWIFTLLTVTIITGSFPINAKSLYHLPQMIKEMEIKIPINIIMSYECRDLINRLLIFYENMEKLYVKN